MFPLLAESGAKRKAKSWKALLITTFNMNTFIYIYVSICDQTLILHILMYLEIATSNFYFLNRLSSLTRTVLYFFRLLELQIHRNYV